MMVQTIALQTLLDMNRFFWILMTGYHDFFKMQGELSNSSL